MDLWAWKLVALLPFAFAALSSTYMSCTCVCEPCRVLNMSYPKYDPKIYLDAYAIFCAKILCQNQIYERMCFFFPSVVVRQM
jgi:hypothetical protein